MTKIRAKPLPLYLYHGLIVAFAPLLGLIFAIRLWRGKEDKERFFEKLGFASRPRPKGVLIWLHAVSLGESRSALTLSAALAKTYPQCRFLLTSTTVSAAKMIAKQRPHRLIHQFAPLDYPWIVRRFLRHWQPDAGVILESEIWPHLLLTASARLDGYLVLAQARLSQKTYHRWRHLPKTIAYLLSHYRLIFAQSARDHRLLQQLSARAVITSGNLKYLNPAPPCNDAQYRKWRKILGTRLCYVAASTHKGEERLFLRIHRRLLRKFPDLLCILIPRHPERGRQIMRLIAKENMRFAARSRNEMPRAETQMFLADSFGESGLFYRLSDIVCVGGSWVNRGGHNLYEAVQWGAVCVHGRFMDNFSGMRDDLQRAGVSIEASDSEALDVVLDDLLSHPQKLERIIGNIAAFADSREDILQNFMTPMQPIIEPKIRPLKK